MKKTTRCLYCGVILPEIHLSEHIAIMHPGKSTCKICGKKLLYNQYSYQPFCPDCESERIKEMGEKDG